MSNVHDFIAIGLGPFNLSLAALTQPIDNLDGLFLEQKNEFNWHPGLMLENVHLQTPFMADLVTLADPTSQFSFLNYCKQKGRLYQFYIREDFFLMRKEYNHYCQWVVNQLSSVQFNTKVIDIVFHDDTHQYEVIAEEAGQPRMYLCKKLIVGTGPTPYLPDNIEANAEGDLIHTLDYLNHKDHLQNKQSITLIGSGQSAAEIYYDLLQDVDQYQLNWVTRSPRFFPLEYSKLTLEMTSPDYIDYFHALPTAKKDQLNKAQKGLYKGINTELINAIYDDLYVKSLDKQLYTDLITNAAFEKLYAHSDRYTLHFHQVEQDVAFHLNTEAVIFATGFHYQLPGFLKNISHLIELDEQERLAVSRHYSVDTNQSIFVQNAELHTHGFTAPDLGMACYRNSTIIKQLTGIEHYPIEQRIAFQTFDARTVSA